MFLNGTNVEDQDIEERPDKRWSPSREERFLRQQAKAQDPLEQGRCPSKLRARITAYLRNRYQAKWARQGLVLESFVGLHWEQLSSEQRRDVRQAFRDLANLAKQKKGRGPQSKGDLDQVLEELARIWVSFTRSEGAARDLIGFKEGPFFTFASAVLDPLKGYDSVTESALRRRWDRLQAIWEGKAPSRTNARPLRSVSGI